MLNPQLDLAAIPQRGSNVLPEPEIRNDVRAAKLVNLFTGQPPRKRHYEPLETDGPATCLVWFD